MCTLNLHKFAPVAVFLISGIALAQSLALATPAEKLATKSEDWFRSDAGQAAVECILTWQTLQGDWPKNTDTTVRRFTGERDALQGTFDNGATTGELRTLARAFFATGDERYQQAFLLGFDHILEAQYANGGWPQYFPLSKGYPRHITFNDDCMIRLMEFLRDFSELKENGLLDAERRAAAKRAVKRGIDCILRCQIVVDGKLTVWCAQHDEITLAPAKARSYELASLSGAESAGILLFLMSLERPSLEVVRAVEAGAQWFEAAKILGYRYTRRSGSRELISDSTAGPLWARFYEIATNRPIFCDRDGSVKYDLKQIGDERRQGYAWYGNWGDRVAKTYSSWQYR